MILFYKDDISVLCFPIYTVFFLNCCGSLFTGIVLFSKRPTDPSAYRAIA